MNTPSYGTAEKPVLTATPTTADRFQMVVDAIQDYAIYMLNPAGLIESWNPGAERLKGYKADEVLGLPYSIFFRPEDVAQGLPQLQLDRARLHGKTEDEGWRVRKDGSTFWANIVISVILDDSGTLIGFAKITKDVTERKRLSELEHSLQRMNEFLAMLGHELRGPLSAIRNSAAYLQNDETPHSKRSAAAHILDRQVDLLTRLLEGLLDAGRLTSGKLRISPSRSLFATVIADAVDAVAPMILQREQRLKIDVPAGEIWVNADATRVTQVLQNLLSNASKFSPNGGQISLTVRVLNERLYVSVEDHGIGMNPSVVDDLFRLFAQGPPYDKEEKSGLGIGLALSRSIVELHGGRITGSSAGLGKGSLFKFELPRALHVLR